MDATIFSRRSKAHETSQNSPGTDPMTWGDIAQAALVGGIATTFMDVVAVLRKRLLGTPSLDYGMVGRWLGHFPRGQFRHNAIGRSDPIPGERALGWTAHYLIGATFAILLVSIAGSGWLEAPTPVPALFFGLASVGAPFLIMQPAMGAGLAACKTPNPWAARARSVTAHLTFGVGMWVGAMVMTMTAA